MKIKIIFLLVVLFTLQTNAQTLNPTSNIATAGTADTFKGGYTFAYPSSGTPWSGALISFGGFSNQYDCQLNSNYFGNGISYRTRNGDVSKWNSWHELATREGNVFNGDQVINGEIYASRSSAVGGAISLINESKATQNAARQWSIFNMTAEYTNSLQFWSYGNNGYQGGSKLTISDNGNVGIGTSSPSNALTVQKVSGGSGASGTDGTGGVRVNWSSGYGVALDAWDNTEPRWGITSFSGNTPTVILEGKYTSKDVYFNSGGNVGIGTITPEEKLHVFGNIMSGNGNGQEGGFFLGNSSHGIKRTANNVEMYTHGADGNLLFSTFFNQEKMRIMSNGNVGIGITDPKNKLSVNGTVWAKEVKVSLTDAADWVFDTNYKLRPLAEVEKFINENKHLPEVPSAEEFRQNDMNVSQMSNKLLQKIEELTLYVIEQNKKLEEQQKNIVEQQNIVKEQNKIIEELKVQVATLMDRKQ
jgi:hypothetical protein